MTALTHFSVLCLRKLPTTIYRCACHADLFFALRKGISMFCNCSPVWGLSCVMELCFCSEDWRGIDYFIKYVVVVVRDIHKTKMKHFLCFVKGESVIIFLWWFILMIIIFNDYWKAIRMSLFFRKKMPFVLCKYHS